VEGAATRVPDRAIAGYYTRRQATGPPSLAGTQIVIPCFNEASRFPTEALLAFVDSCDACVILVDDGSTDETQHVLQRVAHHVPEQIQVLTLPANGGKGEAVRQGILAALEHRGVEYVGYWDADLATPLEEAGRFIDVLENAPRLELILGSRVRMLGRKINRKWYRHYLGRIFATGASMALRLPVYDTQCGAKMFRVTDLTRELVSKRFISRWIFDVELLARLTAALKRRKDARTTEDAVYEVPLDRWSHVAGSKVRPRHFLMAFVDLVRIFACYR
jgi:glycosyltransferase involved in cell wall biosynthesis